MEPPDEAAQEQATDDLALTIIMGIVSNRRLPPAPEEPQADRRDERRSSHRGEPHAVLWGVESGTVEEYKVVQKAVQMCKVCAFAEVVCSLLRDVVWLFLLWGCASLVMCVFLGVLPCWARGLSNR